jgi:hypothetical protein
VTNDAAVAPQGRSPRTRSRRVILPGAVVLLVIGAFLLWGPIGLGNGPLSTRDDGAEGWTDSSPGPVAITFLLRNSGHDQPVIDAVELVGGTSYASPRELGLDAETPPRCADVGPARTDGHGFVLADCGNQARGPLIGRSIGALSQGFLGAAEVAAPRPGSCWAMTKIVIRYHVGIRHYAATDPYALAVCGKGTPSAQVLAAMNAADGSGP